MCSIEDLDLLEDIELPRYKKFNIDIELAPGF